MSIVKSFGLVNFPATHTIPKYEFSELIGPNFSMGILEFLKKKQCLFEVINFDDGEVYFENTNNEQYYQGDFLIVMYINPSDWVYIYSSDIEWGVFLSNIYPNRILDINLLIRAKEDFHKSYHSRTENYKDYYDENILSKWLEIGKFPPF